MSQTPIPPEPNISPESHKPTRFLLRGLAITLPPILTVVILIWLFGMINTYIISPTSTVVRYGFAHAIENSVKTSTLKTWQKLPPLEYCQTNYRVTQQLKSRLERQLDQESADEIPIQWVRNETDDVYVPFGSRSVPYDDYYEVASHVPASEMPATSIGVYMELFTIRYFFSSFHLSAAAVVLAIILLYFIGRIMTVQIGQWMVHNFESRVLARLPVISNVYSSVKQVTDFFFTERTVSYNQVVAVEYPRKGVWSVGFVTSSGMRGVVDGAGEPMLALLMPTSPMPMTGFTIMVPRKECIELDLTVDQAFQYCLSCGVLVPPQQKVTPELLNDLVRQSLGDETGSVLNDETDVDSPTGEEQLTEQSSGDPETHS